MLIKSGEHRLLSFTLMSSAIILNHQMTTLISRKGIKQQWGLLPLIFEKPSLFRGRKSVR